MTILKTIVIDKTKVMGRKQADIESLGLPRGVYRGFRITQQKIPAKGITVSTGSYEDNFLFHKSVDHTSCAAIRYIVNFNIDFNFKTSQDPQTLYIWCDVEYSASKNITAFFRIGNSEDRAKDSVTICKIDIPKDATEILNSYITQDENNDDTITTPMATSPDSNTWGFLSTGLYSDLPSRDEKLAMVAASPEPGLQNPFATESNTVLKTFVGNDFSQHEINNIYEFKIPEIVYVGKGETGTAQVFFGLYADDGGKPSVNEVGYLKAGVPLNITSVFTSDNTAELDPSTEADEKGFYYGPYVHLSVPATGKYWVRYGSEKMFSELNSDSLRAQAVGFIPPVSHGTEFDISAATARKPVTYTVGPDESQNYDFGGPNGLINALNKLENSSLSGGIIYVRGDPNFNVTENKVYTKPVQIIFEGNAAVVLFSHQAGTGITFSEHTEISGGTWVGAGKDILRFNGLFKLSKCKFMGETQFSAYKKGYGSFIDSCYFLECETVFDNCKYTTVRNCHFSPPVGMIALGLNQCSNVVFQNCLVDGSNDNTQGGEGLYVSSSYGLASFENCRFVQSGEKARAISLSAASASSTNFKNCSVILRSNWGNHDDLTGQVEIKLNSAQASVQIDSMDILVGHLQEIDNTILYVLAESDRCKVNINGLRIDGGGNLINGNSSYLSMGAAIGAKAGGKGTQIQFNDGQISNFSHCVSGPLSANLIGVQTSNSEAKIGFQNISISDLATAEIISDTYFIGLMNVAEPLDGGIITIDNCNFDGGGLAIDQDFEMMHYGILGSSEFGLKDPGVMYVTNCKFSNWAAGHIRMEYGDGDTRIMISGYRGSDSIDLDPATSLIPRLYLQSERVMVTNSMYNRSEPNSSGLIWCRVPWSPGIQKPIIASNSIWMTNETSDCGIYIGDAVNGGTIIGNAGNCHISVRDVDNLTGIGDGDYNTNALSVVLR